MRSIRRDDGGGGGRETPPFDYTLSIGDSSMHVFTRFWVTTLSSGAYNCMPSCLPPVCIQYKQAMKLTGRIVMKSSRSYVPIGLWAVKDWIEMVDRREDLLLPVRDILGHRYIVVVLLWGSFRRNVVSVVFVSIIDRNRKHEEKDTRGKNDVVRVEFETPGSGSLGRRREGAQRNRGERERWSCQVEGLPRGWVFEIFKFF